MKLRGLIPKGIISESKPRLVWVDKVWRMYVLRTWIVAINVPRVSQAIGMQHVRHLPCYSSGCFVNSHLPLYNGGTSCGCVCTWIGRQSIGALEVAQLIAGNIKYSLYKTRRDENDLARVWFMTGNLMSMISAQFSDFGKVSFMNVWRRKTEIVFYAI